MKGITVSGTGTVSAAPDIASVEIGAEALAGSASEARTAASEAAARIIAALKKRGLAPADIQTTRITVQPQHDYSSGQQRLTGYQASNMVQATIRDIDSAGPTLDAALEAAGDAARLHGFRFAFSDPAKLATEARTKAVAAARANAQTLARAAGVKLGRVEAITEVDESRPQPRMMMAKLEGAAADMSIEAGESAVTVSVAVRFAIK